MNDNMRGIVIFLVIGLVAGWLASWIIPGSGSLLRYLISGVLGAFVGGYLFSALKINLPFRNIWVSQIVTATAGAVIVMIVAKLIF
ncbi:MAG: GlsB/YeaQ/YmgE family stress response membrane protein [Hyphomicrobiales bacterium]|nr:MAG: GlsB/YeaQ/YmgE family stress response membrane protein [Hyphomicrobiales bacterium]